MEQVSQRAMGRWDPCSQDAGKVFSVQGRHQATGAVLPVKGPGEPGGRCVTVTWARGLQDSVQRVGVSALRGVGFDLF